MHWMGGLSSRCPMNRCAGLVNRFVATGQQGEAGKDDENENDSHDISEFFRVPSDAYRTFADLTTSPVRLISAL
jgi:hypothetical protein